MRKTRSIAVSMAIISTLIAGNVLGQLGYGTRSDTNSAAGSGVGRASGTGTGSAVGRSLGGDHPSRIAIIHRGEVGAVSGSSIGSSRTSLAAGSGAGYGTNSGQGTGLRGGSGVGSPSGLSTVFSTEMISSPYILDERFRCYYLNALGKRRYVDGSLCRP